MWTPEEIAELSGRIKTMVSLGQKNKLEAQKRIDHCEYVKIISPSIADVWKDLME